MEDPPIVLDENETMVLDIYKVRMVNKGLGLTYEVLSSELKSYPDFNVDAALDALVAKGLLSNPQYYKKIYLLTAKGKDYITEYLGAM